MTIGKIPDCTVIGTGPDPIHPSYTKYITISSKDYHSHTNFSNAALEILSCQSGLSKTDRKIFPAFFLSTTTLDKTRPHVPIPIRPGGRFSSDIFYGNNREYCITAATELDTLEYEVEGKPGTYTVRVEGDKRALLYFSAKNMQYLPAPAIESEKKVFHVAIWGRAGVQRTAFDSKTANMTNDIMLQTFFHTEGIKKVAFRWHGLAGNPYFGYTKAPDHETVGVGYAYRVNTTTPNTFLQYWGQTK